MKRILAILMALLLASLPALALAEGDDYDGEDYEEAEAFDEDDDDEGEPGDPFEDGWVCGRAYIHIDESDGEYLVEIQWADSAAVVYEWRYTCAYDAEANALTGVGELNVVTYGEDGEVADTETRYTDGGATFTLDGEDRLHWADAVDNAGADMAFEREAPEGDEDWDDEASDPAGQPYVGSWACGDVTLEIEAMDGEYMAQLRRPISASEAEEWVYECDVKDGALVSDEGDKYVISSNDAGLEVASRVVYENGAAAFALDADDRLTWADGVEDAGSGLLFERVGSGE